MSEDAVYRERNELVAFLSKVFPSHLAGDEAAPDWPIVFIESPAGQLSWHVPREYALSRLSHLPWGANSWDGHSSELKYERLNKITTSQLRAALEDL